MKNKKWMAISLSSIMLLSSVSPIFAADWKETAVNYLQENQMVTGQVKELSPEIASQILSKAAGKEVKVEGALTRENMAHYFAQAAVLMGYHPAKDFKLMDLMKDAKEIDAKNKEDMAACYNLGILVGDGTHLDPKGNMTYYQFAQAVRALKQIPQIDGKVKEINKYGHVVTELTGEEFKKAGFELGDFVHCTINGKEVELPFVKNYVNVDNKAHLVFQDKDNMTLAINMGNFSEVYGVKPGDTFHLTLSYKKGYLEDFKFRDIEDKRTNDRKDYASDEIFANFRNIKMGKLPEGTLYRSSNPANPKLGRAAYVDKFLASAGINTSLDLSEDSGKLEEFFKEGAYQSPYYQALYEAGHVLALNMNADFTSKKFNEKLNRGLKFIIANDGPYLVHCTEGKDRAGYVSALLGALMGGSVDELVKDYMLSYVNYYHVEPNSKQYEALAKSNIITTLKIYAGVKTDEELAKADLQKGTEEYLKKTVGLTQEEINQLKEKLSKTYPKQSMESLKKMEKAPIHTTETK